MRPDLGHLDAVGAAAQLEVERAAELVPRLGPAAVGGQEEAGALDALGLVVGVDARGDERDAGLAVADEAAASALAVDPAGVRACRSITSGRSSRSSRKDLFVVPPSMTTVVS